MFQVDKEQRTSSFARLETKQKPFLTSFQEHVKVLQTRAVAYLNMDMVIRGDFALGGASGPLLEEAVMAVAKKVRYLPCGCCIFY